MPWVYPLNHLPLEIGDLKPSPTYWPVVPCAEFLFLPAQDEHEGGRSGHWSYRTTRRNGQTSPSVSQ
jgi:hypothetical protein